MQVTVGAMLGSGFGLVWFALTVWLAQNWYGTVVRWQLSNLLCLKDTFPIGPDVLKWERSQTLDRKQA